MTTQKITTFRVVPSADAGIHDIISVERAWSQYNHSVARGDELRSYSAAIEAELLADAADWRTSAMPLARGRYIDQLRALTAVFDRRQLHVALFDDLADRLQNSSRKCVDSSASMNNPFPAWSGSPSTRAVVCNGLGSLVC